QPRWASAAKSSRRRPHNYSNVCSRIARMTLETRAPDRQVPFDEVAEQQVIGSLLIDRDAIFKIADLLRVDDFYIPRHQRIYDAAQALLERRERIDPLTIQMELARREEL